MGTLFNANDIIEGEYKGRPYRFRATAESEMGSGSVFAPGIDEISGKKVFLKKYIDPGQRSPWFKDFIEYQDKVWQKVNSSRQAQQIIAGLHLCFQHSNDHGRFWQAIEFVENSKDLKAFLASDYTTWDQRVKFATVFMYAMMILHKEVRIVHGDLKPANLLLIPCDDGNYRIKLIDFDRPLLIDEPKIPWERDGFLGSDGYYSPEHLSKPEPVRPSEKSDVFTCGLILYEMLTKEGHPYNRRSDLEEYKSYSAPIPTLLDTFGSDKKDQEVASMLHRMLDPNIDNRPTAEEVHRCLVSSAGAVRKRTDDQLGSKKTEKYLPPTPVETRPGVADIVFLMDVTGSMGRCINALKENIHQFIHDMVTGDPEQKIVPVEDWRARIVGYRDFDDCNKSKKSADLYRRWGKGGWFIDNPFTRDETVLYKQLEELKAFGGGTDPSESLLDAMMLVMRSGNLPPGEQDFKRKEESSFWRRNRVGKVLVVFTDAGFHHEMSYNYEKTFFPEKEKYPIDLSGAGLNELDTEIEQMHVKIFVFGPDIPDYELLSELPVVILPSNEQDNAGLIKTIDDKSKFSELLNCIIKGVSRSASEGLDIDIDF